MPMRSPPSGMPLRAVIFLMSFAAFSLISTMLRAPWGPVRARTTTTIVLVYPQRGRGVQVGSGVQGVQEFKSGFRKVQLAWNWNEPPEPPEPLNPPEPPNLLNP